MPSESVAAQARRRWLAVAAGAVLVVAAPTLATTAVQAVRTSVGQGAPEVAPRALLSRVLASAAVPHQGVAESRGSLGLPDLPRFGDVAALLGGTTRTRVWWRTPRAWRVDQLTATGEEGTYADGPDAVVTWNYERNRVRTVLGTPSARLPRPDDLLPPQLARRLLADLGPRDGLAALPAGWVAGRPAAGIRATPGDGRSTVGAVEVWADAATGLPLQVRVTTRAGSEAVVSRWTDLELSAPDPALLRPPSPPSSRSDVTTAPDLIARVDALPSWDLPDRLAGAEASPSLVGATATYGQGLARFVVLPLPPGPARDILDGARGLAPPRQLPGGEVAAVRSGVLSALAVVGDDWEHAYVIAGLVVPEVLEDAAKTLLAAPPSPAVGP